MGSKIFVPNISNSTPVVYFHGPYRPQNFSIPDSIIYYITMNPLTSNLYQNITQTCKYFFTKNPIAVLSSLHFTNDGWKTCKRFKPNCEKFGIEKISLKFWITGDEIDVYNYSMNPPLIQTIMSKIYRCDVDSCFFFQQDLSIYELLFFASSASECHLMECVIRDSNGEELESELIIAKLPKIKDFYYGFVERPYMCEGRRSVYQFQTSETCYICENEKLRYLKKLINTENKDTRKAEEIIHCRDCGLKCHLSCLKFTPKILISTKRYGWQCSECKNCSLCNSSESDVKLQYCDDCNRGFHPYCLNPPRLNPSGNKWSCKECQQEFGNKETIPIRR